jgi:protein phosphatase methylesterase 1
VLIDHVREIGWFTGLSKKFLQCRTAKILILAGADRLDKELMIGQMQGTSILCPRFFYRSLIFLGPIDLVGKFQLEVYRDVGHCLQEDAPERTAATLLEFWARNDRTDVLKGVKKVGQV